MKPQADWVDFKAVKTTVSIQMVLSHYSISLNQVNADYLRGKCPLPTHAGESENSLGVNTQKNVWACHAASCVSERGGRKGGNVLDFVAVMEGCTIRDAALKLQNWFDVKASNERPSDYVPPKDRKNGTKQLVAEKEKAPTSETPITETDTSIEPVNQPLEFNLKSVDHSHPYLKKRGIKQETAQHFGSGYFFGKGSMAGRVVIPIHNETGELIAYAGRTIDDTEPKYKLPTGFKKSLVLFNLHRVLELDTKDVIIVEGYFDCMKVHQAGFPNVVALMGSALTEQQETLIVENFDRVVVMLDGDQGGRSATSEIATQLMSKVFVRVVEVPDDSQPDQLSSDQICQLLNFLT